MFAYLWDAVALWVTLSFIGEDGVWPRWFVEAGYPDAPEYEAA